MEDGRQLPGGTGPSRGREMGTRAPLVEVPPPIGDLGAVVRARVLLLLWSPLLLQRWPELPDTCLGRLGVCPGPQLGKLSAVAPRPACLNVRSPVAAGSFQ